MSLCAPLSATLRPRKRALPASADRLSTSSQTLDPLYFFYRHLAWQVLALGTLFGVSMLARDNARRFGLLLVAGMARVLAGGFEGVEVRLHVFVRFADRATSCRTCSRHARRADSQEGRSREIAPRVRISTG